MWCLCRAAVKVVLYGASLWSLQKGSEEEVLCEIFGLSQLLRFFSLCFSTISSYNLQTCLSMDGWFFSPRMFVCLFFLYWNSFNSSRQLGYDPKPQQKKILMLFWCLLHSYVVIARRGFTVQTQHELETPEQTDTCISYIPEPRLNSSMAKYCIPQVHVSAVYSATCQQPAKSGFDTQ